MYLLTYKRTIDTAANDSPTTDAAELRLASAHYNLGLALQEQGRHEEAKINRPMSIETSSPVSRFPGVPHLSRGPPLKAELRPSVPL
jgi:hypothetical protein